MEKYEQGKRSIHSSYLTENGTPMEAKVKSHELLRYTSLRLKEIGKSLNNDHLSTYSARHIFFRNEPARLDITFAEKFERLVFHKKIFLD